MNNNDGIKRIKFNFMGLVDVDIVLRGKYTIINDDSGTGKTYFFNTVKEYVMEVRKKSKIEQNIVCLNTNNVDLKNTKPTMELLKETKDSIIIIDQADYILNCSNIRDYIEDDESNYYIIMSRKLVKDYDSMAYLIVDETSIKLDYYITTVVMRDKLAKIEGGKE